MNPERLVVGLAVAFDSPARNGRVWRREQFEDFVASGHAVAMHAYRHPNGDPAAVAFGTWRAFALIAQGSAPPGLLVLGEVEHSAVGERLLAELNAAVDPWGGRGEWGLSAETCDISAAADDSIRWLSEITVTRAPAHESCRVIGVGEYAGDVWTLLTGLAVPRVVTAPRAIRRRLVGAFTDGRPIFGDEGSSR